MTMIVWHLAVSDKKELKNKRRDSMEGFANHFALNDYFRTVVPVLNSPVPE